MTYIKFLQVLLIDIADGVAGRASDDFGLVRYASDGSLDTGFDSDGKVTTNFGSSDYGEAVELQSDGKIVVAGYTGVTGSRNFASARYLSTGALDTAFDGDGMLSTDIDSLDNKACDALVQPDGKILLGGYVGTTSPPADFAVVRIAGDVAAPSTPPLTWCRQLGATKNGGAGNDVIDATDRAKGNAARDVVLCGSGRDSVTADRNDKVAKDCEKVVRQR